MMSGSGIEEAFSEIYAGNAVAHMSGKAFSRALRGRFIVDSALNNMLLNEVAGNEEEEMDKLSLEDKIIIEKAYDNTLLSSTALEDKSLEALGKLREMLSAKEQNRTAHLWLQYMDYIDVVKLYIRAERSGNWQMHLAKC